jgi:hypothetical protein
MESTLFSKEGALLLGKLGPFPKNKFIISQSSCVFHKGIFLPSWRTCLGLALSFLLLMEVISLR